MLRKLIALVIIFAITFAGFVDPACADSSKVEIMPANSLIEVRGNNNSLNFNNSFNDSSSGFEGPVSDFFNAVVDGAVKTVGVAVGGVLACYTIDGIATMFFPPAATLSAFCPSFGAASGGTSVVFEGAKAVTGVH